MLPHLIFLLSQRTEEAPQPHDRLRPAPESPFASPSALGAFEEELIAVRKGLRPALVQVRIPLPPADESGEPREVLVSGVVVDHDDLLVAPGPIPWRDGSVVVVRFDDEEFPAVPVAEDPLYGLTLLRAPGLGIEPPPLGDCESLPEGTVTVGLGNAYGLTASLSLGIIAGKERSLGAMEHLLQVTNAVNPGDGGGLLADRRGQVVAILLTSLAEVERRQLNPDRPQEDSGFWRCQDVSFAVPIERVLEGFAAHLTVAVQGRRQIGVVIDEELDPRNQSGSGRANGSVLVVKEVFSESPAERAGVQVGDRIVRVDGQPVESLACLRTALAAAGAELNVDLMRAGERLQIRIEFPLAAETAPRY